MATVPMAEVLDEQFNSDLLIAKALISQLIHTEDREICCRWVKKLCSLKSDEPLVKKHRNSFFKYMLKVIKNSTIEDKQNSLPGYNDNRTLMLEKQVQFTSHWTPDRRTYIAAKPLPGKGALVYMAVAKDPNLGWDFPYE